MSKEINNEKFVKLYGFNSDANLAVNKAIQLAKSHKCEAVYIVHIFLALLDKCKGAGSLLKRLDTDYDTLMQAYTNLATDGEYGINELIDTLDVTPEYMDKEVLILCSYASGNAFTDGKDVSAESLFELITSSITDNDKMMQLLEEAGVDTTKIEELECNSIEIPKELRNVVEDMNASREVVTASIKGVDNYIDEAFEVLSRKVKANPCFIGHAGVGKTSIVYGIVQKIYAKKAPEQFMNTHICYINGATITSGMRFRGDFEHRMKTLIDWAKKEDVILFLDEIHTFISAGKGSEDSAETAGNMIKNALSDGSIKIIGATTLEEYHKYIEADSAFNRRLQTIVVNEPDVNTAIDMIKGTIRDYEIYHDVKVPDKTIELAVKLSDRYMKDKYLPDKAYTIIDHGCAVVKLNHEHKLDTDTILSVVSKATGVNINKMTESSAKSLINLEKIIGSKLIGQDEAVEKVSKAIRRGKAGVREEQKPIASFLFVGPTGVGKTELCKVLSSEITPGKDSFIKIDMSEYSEKHSISKMIGSPPGYVGYGEGGQLTEKVKHNPYSVILFDEIEKADHQIFNALLQLLDEGRMTDGHGDTVDFTNCVIIMTSNAGYGADGLTKKSLGFGNKDSESEDTDKKEKIVRAALEETFRPEFLNRFDDIVVFNKLLKEDCIGIAELLLNKLASRVFENNNIELTFSSELAEHIANSGYSDKYGARNLKRRIQKLIEDELAIKLIDGSFEDGEHYIVDYDANEKSIKIM